ncbi:MAG: Response regulator receiver [uncultured bacterium]|nr:MAG: Response regulator receiver [uncultured bacterium]OGH14006.1 MAG: hypothetical protein A2687_06085 [Candidatus Levybacteria bacterium RIFCSPHIGHO2_01_FULL_38_26]
MRKKEDKKRILIVDDDPAILDALRIVLEMEGYEVITLSSTDKIYKEVRSRKPSLILLDIWLPGGIDGTEVTRFIKAQEDLSHISVILISAVSNIRKMFKNSHADDFLAKPFDIDDVIEKANKYL